MSADIIYNHVSTGRGKFYRFDVVGLAFIEKHNDRKNSECIINRRGDIAIRDLVINPM